MSGRLTADEDGRYALSALCVRRDGDCVLVEATNGHMAWQFPADWADPDDLPEFAGEVIADGQRVLIDTGTAKMCLRALPKRHSRPLWTSAFLAVDGKVGVLHTATGASFRLTRYDEDAGWPDFEGYIPERAGPCVTLSAERLSRITAWVDRFLYEKHDEKPLTLSFFPHVNAVRVRFDVPREGGPVGVLAPLLVDDGAMLASMPAWRAAFGEGEE